MEIEGLYKQEFGKVLSYNRFIELMPRLFLPLSILQNLLLGKQTGIYFIDSTTIPVCHNKRRCMNKVFRGLAKSGKSSMGYFFGFKLHIVINHRGELVAIKITQGNVDDRVPVLELTRGLKGKMFADKGYIKQNLFLQLLQGGLKMIHGIKKNMKNKPMILEEKLLLRRRNLIETVFDYLKNKMNLQHTRHRSPVNAFVHILSTLVAYSLKKYKPSLNTDFHYAFSDELIPN
jgi:hypothetical protein